MNSGAYEAAAGSCYAIFRCLAKTCKENEDWFAGFTGYGDTYTKLAIFTEAVVELYCHLRQKPDLSKRMADEMDINLEVFNLGETKHKITFSKKGRPTGVKEGDILIAYSIGTMQLISVFVAGNDDDRGELTKFPIPGDDKWPYYIWCKNETSQYGASWSKKKLSLHSLRDEFLRCHPTSTVLPSGNKMNALQWGADHVRTTAEFGEFVVNRMKGEL